MVQSRPVCALRLYTESNWGTRTVPSVVARQRGLTNSDHRPHDSSGKNGVRRSRGITGWACIFLPTICAGPGQDRRSGQSTFGNGHSHGAWAPAGAVFSDALLAERQAVPLLARRRQRSRCADEYALIRETLQSPGDRDGLGYIGVFRSEPQGERPFCCQPARRRPSSLPCVNALATQLVKRPVRPLRG